ncbi:hypothetical protein [Pseudonocardia sp. NPDC049635]|uniref:hypothetical protein n=1 Tax=Pseudonocardia sp. NPDC049635 TaxID=3155506 RepID=UPI0033C2389A
MTPAEILTRALRHETATIRDTPAGAHIAPDGDPARIVATLHAFAWTHHVNPDGTITVPAAAFA